MSNIVIEIKAPELANALQALAAAIAGRQTDKPSCPVPEPKSSAPVPAPKPVPAPAVPVSVAPPAPAPTVPTPAPIPVAAPVAAPAASVPAAPPQPVVPTSAPQYTYEMLFNAAAALMGLCRHPPSPFRLRLRLRLPQYQPPRQSPLPRRLRLPRLPCLPHRLSPLCRPAPRNTPMRCSLTPPLP